MVCGGGFWDGVGFREGDRLALVPATVFLRRLPATGGGVKLFPRHISSSRAHSEKFSTATPTFWGSTFLVVVLPMS